MTTRDRVTEDDESGGLTQLSTGTGQGNGHGRRSELPTPPLGRDITGLRRGGDGSGDGSVGGGRAQSIRVLLAISEESLRREVLDFLGRSPRVDIAGSVDTPEALARVTDEVRPQVTVVCPHTVARVPDRSKAATPHVLAVTEDMTVGVLRDAIRVGAEGVFEWPADRTELIAAVGQVVSTGSGLSADRGMIVAIAGTRGGAGSTFVASHLAAAFVGHGRRAVLVDADPRHADLTAALGITPEENARTVQDLVPVIPELSPEHIEDALYSHARGFRVLLGPREADPEVRLGLYRGVVALLSFEYDPVLLHVARAEEASAKAITDLADAIVLVTTLDLFSLYGAKRMIGALGLESRPERCVVVVNRSGRSSIGPRDIQRVLGIAPATRIRSDRRIRRLQDRGRLLPARSAGAGRDIRRLANHLLRLQPAAIVSGRS